MVFNMRLGLIALCIIVWVWAPLASYAEESGNSGDGASSGNSANNGNSGASGGGGGGPGGGGSPGGGGGPGDSGENGKPQCDPTASPFSGDQSAAGSSQYVLTADIET